MTLTSLSFFIFVFAVLAVYYICPVSWRYLVLLAASMAFYVIVGFKYLPFILFTTIVTWAGAIWLQNYNSTQKKILKEHKQEWSTQERKQFKQKVQLRKRLILTLILVVNFGILAVLKYYNFFAEWMGQILHVQIPGIGILLPLGISFYTFQSMGYMIDIYWEKIQPEKNLAKFALFVTFFPQIVQGPIAVYSDLAPQLYEGHKLQYENIKYGFQLMLWGLFKKMVIADRLIVSLNTLLPQKNEISNAYNLLLVLIYMAQLYMDFSGGIDIARGVAEMLGIHMAVNFKRPFFSNSTADFWRRWHISLCNWLKAYLFYPIAISKAFLRFGSWIGSHSKEQEQDLPEDSLWGGFTFLQHLGRVLPGCIATLITFFIIGMWHGANWKYAGYGLWNGIIILIAMLLDPVFKWLLKKWRIRIDTAGWKVWRIIRTVFIVGLSFAFDIADSLVDGLKMIWKCLTPTQGPAIHVGNGIATGLELYDWMVVILGLLLVFAVSLYQELSGQKTRVRLDAQSKWVQWVLTLGCFTAVIIFGMYGPGVSSGEFVYMQF